jgi:hypothetical protein
VKKAENKKTKKKYPLMPYLIGLLITVIALVLISYMAELRNTKGELQNHNEIIASDAAYTVNYAD